MLVDVIDRLEAHYGLARHPVCLLCLGFKFHDYSNVRGEVKVSDENDGISLCTR